MKSFHKITFVIFAILQSLSTEEQLCQIQGAPFVNHQL